MPPRTVGLRARRVCLKFQGAAGNLGVALFFQLFSAMWIWLWQRCESQRRVSPCAAVFGCELTLLAQGHPLRVPPAAWQQVNGTKLP